MAAFIFSPHHPLKFNYLFFLLQGISLISSFPSKHGEAVYSSYCPLFIRFLAARWYLCKYVFILKPLDCVLTFWQLSAMWRFALRLGKIRNFLAVKETRRRPFCRPNPSRRLWARGGVYCWWTFTGYTSMRWIFHFPPPYFLALLASSISWKFFSSLWTLFMRRSHISHWSFPFRSHTTTSPLSESESYSTFLLSTSEEGGEKGEWEIWVYFPVPGRFLARYIIFRDFCWRAVIAEIFRNWFQIFQNSR